MNSTEACGFTIGSVYRSAPDPRASKFIVIACVRAVDVDHREVDASRSPWVTRVMCGTGRPVRSRLNVQNCARIVR